MTNVLGTLQNFYIQNTLPEVLTSKTENSAPKIFDGQKVKLYCFCNSPYSSDKTWIDCDSDKCKWVWFHLSCVHLKGVLRSNWYCPVCRKEKQKLQKPPMQKIRKGKHRYLWKNNCFHWIKVFTQMFITLWMKCFRSKSDFIFVNSSHKRAKYLDLCCVIGRNSATLITFLVLIVDLFIIYYSIIKV